MCPHSYLVLFLLFVDVSTLLSCSVPVVVCSVTTLIFYCWCCLLVWPWSYFCFCVWCLLFLFLFVRDACYFCFVPGQPWSVWGRERSWCGVSWSMSGQLVEPRNRSVWSLCCACSSLTPAWSTSTWDMSRVSTATYVRKSRTSAAEPFLVITVFNRSCVPVWPCPLRLWRLSHLQNHASSACLIRDPLSQ